MTTKGERTKKIILQQAITLFSKNSFKNVTIRQIAKASNISPASIYKYYSTQEDLYYAAMQFASKNLLELLCPTKTLEQFVQVYIHHMFTSEVLFEIMTYFMLDQEKNDEYLPISNEINLFLKILEKKIPGENSKIEAQLLFSTLNGLIISYKKLPNKERKSSLEAVEKLTNYYILHLKKRI